MIDWPYAHLLVNHFSVILTYVGLAAALLAMVVRRRRALWLYAVATLTLAGLAAYPAVFTGTRAVTVMEKQWYVEEAVVDEHEVAGERAQWILLAMGALAAYSWWRMTRSRGESGSPSSAGDALARDLPIALRTGVVVAALMGAGAVAYAAYEGGFIVHKATKLAAPSGAELPAAALPVRADSSAPKAN